MQIAGETFRSLYVEGGWSLPLEAAAELLLDGRWTGLPPESSVDYPSS